jgi:hypothetical protein
LDEVGDPAEDAEALVRKREEADDHQPKDRTRDPPGKH